MMVRNNPCYGCNRRNDYCHATCPEYAEFHQKCEKDLETRRMYGQLSRDMRGLMTVTKIKVARKRA